MIKLKDILLERYAWERKPGGALPTLADVKRIHEQGQEAPEYQVYKTENGEKTNDVVGTHQYGKGFIPNELGKKLGLKSHPTSIPNYTIIDKEEEVGDLMNKPF